VRLESLVKVSKATRAAAKRDDREVAALICSALACNGGWARQNSITATRNLTGGYSVAGERQRGLALKAIARVARALKANVNDPESAAEAEALIRSGWRIR
jgi:hypothetical protein